MCSSLRNILYLTCRLTQYNLSPFIWSYSAKVISESKTKAQISEVLWQPGCVFVVDGLDLDPAGTVVTADRLGVKGFIKRRGIQ